MSSPAATRSTTATASSASTSPRRKRRARLPSPVPEVPSLSEPWRSVRAGVNDRREPGDEARDQGHRRG